MSEPCWRGLTTEELIAARLVGDGGSCTAFQRGSMVDHPFAQPGGSAGGPAGSFESEAMTLLKSIAKLLDTTQKKRHDCQASEISEGCRKEHLQIAQAAASSKVLKSFQDPAKTIAIEEAVTEFSKIMLAHYQANQLDERTYTQRRVKDVLWKKLACVLSCQNSVSLVNEKPYELSLVGKESDLCISGKTDHTVKMTEADAYLLTIEDKNICKDLTLEDVAQAHSQALFEVNNLSYFFFCEPPEYVGVLVNGRDWIFVHGYLVRDRRVWHYVKLSPTFNETGVIAEAITRVSRFLEHALVIVDELFVVLSSPRVPVPTMSLLNISEEDEGGGDDYEDQSDDGCDGEGPVKGPPGPRLDKALSSLANRSKNTSSDVKHGMGKKKIGEVQQRLFDKESHYAPLTYANVGSLQERAYKIIS